MEILPQELKRYMVDFMDHKSLINLKQTCRYNRDWVTKGSIELQAYKEKIQSFMYNNLVFSFMFENYTLESDYVSKIECFRSNNLLYELLFSFIDETLADIFSRHTDKVLHTNLQTLFKELDEYEEPIVISNVNQSIDLCKKCYKNLTCKRVLKVLEKKTYVLELRQKYCDFCETTIENMEEHFCHIFRNYNAALNITVKDYDIPVNLLTKDDLIFNDPVINLLKGYDSKFI